jgi:hypothetical protein
MLPSPLLASGRDVEYRSKQTKEQENASPNRQAKQRSKSVTRATGGGGGLTVEWNWWHNPRGWRWWALISRPCCERPRRCVYSRTCHRRVGRNVGPFTEMGCAELAVEVFPAGSRAFWKVRPTAELFVDRADFQIGQHATVYGCCKSTRTISIVTKQERFAANSRENRTQGVSNQQRLELT